MNTGVDYSNFFPLLEYYEKVVVPIDTTRFGVRKSTGKNSKVICCLHPDKDPSLGFRKTKKGEEFHCFGCNLTGDVVDLHIKVSHLYFNKRFDNKDNVLKDLCRIFNVSYKDLPSEAILENSTDRDLRKEVALRDAVQEWGFGDFKDGMIQGKLENRGIPYFNTLLIRMVDVVKSRGE